MTECQKYIARLVIREYAKTIIVEGKKTAGYTSRETTDDGVSP